MRVALHDVDSKIPNLALMKLSASHKARGDSVEFYSALWDAEYDMVYSSKVFSWTPGDNIFNTAVVRGGSGYNRILLVDEIEHLMPDYDLYGCDYSMGFTTRGCPRSCAFCIVPEKEGHIRHNANISEFLAHKNLVLMDNNIFALKGQFEKIAEQCLSAGVRVDFNQGLDIRLLTPERAAILKKLKPLKQWRFAYDSLKYEQDFRAGAEMLHEANVSKAKVCVYVLAGFDDDMDGALTRIQTVYHEYGFDPFVMVYRDFTGKTETDAKYNNLKNAINLPAWKKHKALKDLARWVNHKAIFKSVKFEDYFA